MKYQQFRIRKHNKLVFNSKFSSIFADDIAKFSSYGEQPLMTWRDEEGIIEINSGFIDNLLEVAKTELQQLIRSLQ